VAIASNGDETFDLPAGFGVRQPPGAVESIWSSKAPEGWRSPRRMRANSISHAILDDWYIRHI
jgi:hypothetical protein